MMSIEYRLVRVTLDQFAILRDTPPANPLQMNITWKSTFGAVAEDRILGCKMKVEYIDEGQLILVMEANISYEIHPKSWHYFDKGDMIVIPPQFQCNMMFHTLGTMRGIMFCKTEGTPYNQLVLPPFNVEKLATGDFKIPK